MELHAELIELFNEHKSREVIEKVESFLDANPQYRTIDYIHFQNPIEAILYDIYIERDESIRQLDFGEALEEIYSLYAGAQLLEGNGEKALENLKIARQINPVSARVLMRLCECHQKLGGEENLKELAEDILKYTYEKDLLTSAYFKLADYHFHTREDMELYDHLLKVFMTLRGEEEDVFEDIEYLESNGVHVGFNPEIESILLYLIDMHSEIKEITNHFKAILDEIVEFESQISELRSKSYEPDNRKLEEIMKRPITPATEYEFLNVLKNSQLFMPVTMSENMFEGIENAKVGDIIEPEGQVGFDINYLTDEDGNKAVPLFTSNEIIESVGLRSSMIAMYMSDLAEMLKQSDRYDLIAINPMTDDNINIPIEAFLDIFKQNE